MKVTASIVTYNSANEISEVLNSLSQAKNIEIFVIDNASEDNTREIVKKEFPEIKLIASPKNLGFGGGHNLAIEQIDSNYHIIVNPDISVEKDEIEKMLSYMEANPDVVVLTPRVLNTDGSEQFLPKRRPNLKYLFGGRLESKFKVCYRWRSEYTMRDEHIETPIQVDFATGCFMVCRSEALKKIGGFDERYFLYFEDADLTREMQKIGKTMYVPSVHVTHKWKRENGKLGKGFFLALHSMFKYFRKWRKYKTVVAKQIEEVEIQKKDVDYTGANT